MATQSERLLFQPLRIGGIEVKGRLAKAAYTETMCTEDGFVTDQIVDHYEELARGGTPLLITGAAYFDQWGQAMKRGLAIDNDDKIDGLRRLTGTVQKYGSKIFMQIYHVGRQANPKPVGRTSAQAPSALKEKTVGCMPHAMSIEEIRQTVRLFGEAAERAQKAGFDGVEFHAAHGYLISSFLTPRTNRRTDEYGGSFENRIRILVEVVQAARAKVGPDFPIILKLNGDDDLPKGNLGIDDFVKIALRMQDEGIDGIEVTAGHYESYITSDRAHWDGFFNTLVNEGSGQGWPWAQRAVVRLIAPLLDRQFNKKAGFFEAFNLRFAREFKKHLKIPVICVGGFADHAQVHEALESGGCDMVSAARPIIADPHLYRHLQEGKQGPTCVFCNGCFARSGAMVAECYHPDVKAAKDRMLREEAAI